MKLLLMLVNSLVSSRDDVFTWNYMNATKHYVPKYDPCIPKDLLEHLSRPYPFKYFKGCLPQNLLEYFVSFLTWIFEIFWIINSRISLNRKSENITFKSSHHQRCSIEKGVLKIFANFTGKDLHQNLF